MGVIQDNSGLQASKTFTVPLNPGDFMIWGLWPHSKASLWLTAGKRFNRCEFQLGGGRRLHNYPCILTTTPRASSGRFPRSWPCLRIPVHVTISGRSPGGTHRRQPERKESRKVSFQAKTRGGELQSAPAGASGRHTAPALGAKELELHTRHPALARRARASRVSVSKLPGTCGLSACLQSGCHNPRTGGSKKPRSQQQSSQK